MENLYEVLEVAQTATKKEIKKSYYSLAKKYHPDHNQGDAKAAERFKAVGEAYRILSDDASRAEYDQKLAAGPDKTAGSAAAPGAKQPPPRAGQRTAQPSPNNIDFQNIAGNFASFFGFDPKSMKVTNEDKLNTYTSAKQGRKANPLDASDLFEQFMGIGKQRR
ncbi:MAG: DnaJ domain-containing protein [Selenomonadaceae bacterium]|nr:DnaJ domain-containing protein [Selenomonadaceae bacterium]